MFLPQPKATVKGPGGITASYDWQASKDPTAGYLLQAVLKNDVATY